MKIYGVTGWKNTGKTGLMERLVAAFTAQGLRIATLKHAHHATDVDREGTDSFRHRKAGARQDRHGRQRQRRLGDVVAGLGGQLDTERFDFLL